MMAAPLAGLSLTNDWYLPSTIMSSLPVMVSVSCVSAPGSSDARAAVFAVSHCCSEGQSTVMAPVVMLPVFCTVSVHVRGATLEKVVLMPFSALVASLHAAALQ